jgi:hypothetical protein
MSIVTAVTIVIPGGSRGRKCLKEKDNDDSDGHDDTYGQRLERGETRRMASVFVAARPIGGGPPGRGGERAHVRAPCPFRRATRLKAASFEWPTPLDGGPGEAGSCP